MYRTTGVTGVTRRTYRASRPIRAAGDLWYARGVRTPSRPSRWHRIREVVARIPRGNVATYGQIATLAGLDGHARQVGYALHTLPEESGVPWHRVVNARGEISPRGRSDSHEVQKLLLEAEGVTFDRDDRVDLGRFRWVPSD